MASEEDLNGLDIPEFGFLPFDLFVLNAWDSSSPLSITAQKKQLVEEWIEMGILGRREYLGRIPYPEEIPRDIPQNLLSPRERAHSGTFERTLFIRTWYGEPGNLLSQEKADADYAHLVHVVGSVYGGIREMMNEFFIFDNEEEFSCSLPSTDTTDPEFLDGVAILKSGSKPSYILAALMHCPDQLDGTRIENLDDAPSAEDLEGWQKLLVLVADREACEDGWVLSLGLDHQGRVLPFRIRDAADWVSTMYANWADGQALAENTDDPELDQLVYMDHGGCGDGWDC